jgi:predicted RNase H-like nuclease (RuvC/YqgF family)
LTREEELEGIINDQATQLEALSQGHAQAPNRASPPSLDMLAKMAELLQQNKDLNDKLSKQERQIEKLVKDNEDLQKSIYDVRELAKGVIKSLEEEVARILLSVAEDRRRIAMLEEPLSKIPQPKVQDRGDMLRLLLAANSGKMLAKDARHKLDISKSLFSQLLASMKDQIESKPLKQNQRERVISLKKIV